MATLRGRNTSKVNKANYKSRVSKSLSNFSVFDQTQIQEFKEAFNIIDQDKDGIISPDDLKSMMSSLGWF